MLQPVLKKNDRLAHILILSVSFIVFAAVVVLDRLKMKPEWPFEMDVHIFAFINAFINGTVFILLILGLWAVKQKNYLLHKRIMLGAIILSILFLVSYIMHHLFAGSTSYGGEGAGKAIYLIILLTHIPLAGIILPFILYASYRGLTGEFAKHRKVVRYTFPLWLYVALTGVLVYVMISPYYA